MATITARERLLVDLLTLLAIAWAIAMSPVPTRGSHGVVVARAAAR